MGQHLLLAVGQVLITRQEPQKLCGPLPKTPEILAIQTPLVKAATTLAANCRALARAWSEDDFHHNRNLASGDADDCVFWLELLAAAGNGAGGLGYGLAGALRAGAGGAA